MAVLFFFHAASLRALPITTTHSDSLTGERARLLTGEVIVALSNLQEGVTGIEGQIYIAAPPKKVWEVITDFKNHKNFVPNIIDSDIISDNGIEIVMYERAGTDGNDGLSDWYFRRLPCPQNPECMGKRTGAYDYHALHDARHFCYSTTSALIFSLLCPKTESPPLYSRIKNS